MSRQWTILDTVRPKPERRLPVLLTREEVSRILKCVRFPIYRVCLLTIYSCGLRLLEGCTLKVSDIDPDIHYNKISWKNRGKVIHVEQGKGGKDRYVPLPDRTLIELRYWYTTHRYRYWLFNFEMHLRRLPNSSTRYPGKSGGAIGSSTFACCLPYGKLYNTFTAKGEIRVKKR